MTPLWTTNTVAEAVNGQPTTQADITGISIDTRTLKPGDLFIALQADNDGHDHIPQALANGAAAILASNPAKLPQNAHAILVADTLQALTALGQAARARFTGQLVAITGSVGKTTTKEMLRTALAPYGQTHAAEASYNNHWGVPLTLARLPPTAAFAVIEIGMNNPGEILPLARLAAPGIAVITTIATAHIGHMGSLQAIAAEKAAILRALPQGGTAILPSDGEFAAYLRAQAPGPVLTFGPNGDARLDTPDQATIAGHPLPFHLSPPGDHMRANALATLATIHALGLDPTKAAAALAHFTPGPGRGQQRTIGDILLLDESYNASGASVRAALGVLRQLPATRRLAVLGDMLELGTFAQAEHQALAPDVARSADLLYACGPFTRSLFDLVPPTSQGAHAPDAATLAPLVAAAIRPGDAVLVKGSLGSRMRLVVQALEQAAPGVPT